MKKINIAKFFLIMLLLPTASLAEIITGGVIKISDGDTLTILPNTNIQLKMTAHHVIYNVHLLACLWLYSILGELGMMYFV